MRTKEMAMTGAEVRAPNFEGFTGRECGEHRTVGAHRAWCHDCHEWCYPHDGCRGCNASDVLCYTNREKAGYEDAVFIAAMANAVRAVAILHARVHDGYLGADVCGHCSDSEGGSWAMWPCRTMQLIAEATTEVPSA